MNKLLFSILLIFVISACNNVDRSSQTKATRNILSNDSVTSNKKSLDDTIKSNFNGDSLKISFTENPFDYKFKNERTVDGTLDTHVEGYEDETNYRKYIDIPNELVINYNLNSRKASSVTFYLNHFNTNNIRLKDCEKLFSFIEYFDSNASKYLRKNFNTIFYNQAANDKLTNYKTDVMEMFVDHNLFDARKFQKESENSTTSQYVDCTIKFF